MTTLPHDLDVERALLRELILDSQLANSLIGQISSNLFHIEGHRVFYSLLEKLSSQGNPIDYDAINSMVNNQLSELISTTFLELLNSPQSGIGPDVLLVTLTELYFKRQLIAAANDILVLSQTSNSSVEQLLGQAEDILDLVLKEKPLVGINMASDVLLEAFVDLENRSKTGSLSGIATGFSDLDLVTQGFQRSDLIIIAGRPSMGKTSLALNLARNSADLQNIPVVFFSLEMSRQQIIYRFLSIESHITTSQLRTGNLTRTEWIALKRAVNSLANLDIYLDDTFTPSISSMVARLQSIKQRTTAIGLIIIDYLQLLGSSSSVLTRVQELSRVTRDLKRVAKDLDVPVIVLSQLSRSVELRPNKRPILADLRESGCVPENTMLYVPALNRELPLKDFILSRINVNSIHTLSLKSAILKSSTTQVKRVFCTGKKLIYKLESLHIKSIHLTKNHCLWTNQGWKPLEMFDRNTLILVHDIFNFPRSWIFTNTKDVRNTHFIFTSVTTIASGSSSTISVYDLWVPPTNSFVSHSYILHNSIEQDADLVLMLYRESYYEDVDPETDDDITEIIISKHRNGPTGTIYTLFDQNISSFMGLLN